MSEELVQGTPVPETKAPEIPPPAPPLLDLMELPVRPIELSGIKNRRQTYPWIGEEYAKHIRVETEWIHQPGAEVPKWDKETQEKVGTGVQRCPLCQDTRSTPHHYQGRVTGLRITQEVECRCVLYRRFWNRWTDPASIGRDLQGVSLDNIRKFQANFRHFVANDKFEELIQTVEKFPFNGYLLTGPHGFGKSTLLAALYRHALETACVLEFTRGPVQKSVFFANATVLSREFVAWANRSTNRDELGTPTKPPSVTVSAIRSAADAGYAPSLFLEEFDKIKLNSEFQGSEFHQIFEAIHSVGGTIVATSNLSYQELVARLGKQYGGGMVRRIMGPRGNPGVDPVVVGKEVTYPDPDPSKGGFLIDFWANTIEQNKQYEPGNLIGKRSGSTTKHYRSEEAEASPSPEYSSQDPTIREKSSAFTPRPVSANPASLKGVQSSLSEVKAPPSITNGGASSPAFIKRRSHPSGPPGMGNFSVAPPVAPLGKN